MVDYIETDWIDTQISSYTTLKEWQDPRFVVRDHVVNHRADWSLEILTRHMLALAWWLDSEESEK